ncbi:MAG: DNA translocase FtsK [Anaerolineae bacterium]|nr:DNA translocase FtsK [Anaerolineae bacterium]
MKKNVRTNWYIILRHPLLRQIAALMVTALGAIILLALLGATRGRWIDPWTARLRFLLGWGAYPAGVGILLAGVLWLRHQLDRPLSIRWRPLVGVEVTLFSLLGLTHAISAPAGAWEPVGKAWGSGLVGWAISTILSTYLGRPAAALILFALTALGLGLTFDLTWEDLRRAIATWRDKQAARAARRSPAEHTPTGREPAARHISATPAHARPRPSAPPPAPSHTPPAPAYAPAEAEKRPPKEPSRYALTLPPITLLNEPEGPSMSDEEILRKSNIIKETLAQFGLPVEVTEVRVGPTVTQFGVTPGYLDRSGAAARKVRVNQISALADDLALALAAPRVRIEAPVPGRPYVGIEVPNNRVQLVRLREVMESRAFHKLDSPLAICLGQDVAGEPVVADLARMPHLLIAGTTGSGKSVCIKAIITCLIFNNTPADLRLVLIDPKMVELVRFNGLPHLYGHVEVDLERIVKVLRWVAWEMDNRYKLFAAAAARHIDDYNRLMKQKGEPTLPRIVVLIDELADLMMLAPEEVERTICRIAQMARATGIHLVVATQRPSTDVVTGLIKANFPARISFATVSQVDSRVILDMPGAETLMGRGDMLYLAPDSGYPVRVQGCYVSEEEEERVVHFWREQVGPMEEEAPWERLMRPGARGPAPPATWTGAEQPQGKCA